MTKEELVASARSAWDSWRTGILSTRIEEMMADWHLFLQPESPATRRVVQSHVEDDYVLVLCNDGAMFNLTDGGARWRALPPVPQPEP